MSGAGAPPAPHPAQRALEAALCAVIVLVALWAWRSGLDVAAPPAGAAPDTLERLAELRREGRGQVPLALTALVAAAALGAFGAVVLGAARAAAGRGALAALGAWWRERTAGLGAAVATLSVGHFLLAFGAAQLAQAPALFLLWPAGQVVVDGEPVDVAAAHEVAPVDTAVKASFAPVLGGMRVRVTGGPVLVDGAPAGPGVVEVGDGATVEVGGQTVVVRAPPPGRQLATFAAAQALSVLALIGGARLLGGRSLLERLGLTTRGLGREVRRGAVAFLAALPAYLVVAALWSALGEALGVPPRGHALIGLLERDGPRLAPIVALQAVALAPLDEELVFRALLVPALARVAGVPGAVALSALVFACAHPGFPSLGPMLVLGTLFAGLYVTSPERSLAGAITAHALFNGLMLLLVVTVQLA